MVLSKAMSTSRLLLKTQRSTKLLLQSTLQLEGKWAKSEPLGDGDGFQLTLNIDDLFDNETKSKRVFLKVYEGDDKRWPIIYWIEITLPHVKA